MNDCQLICSDAIEWAKSYKGEPFHAMICDPPYHLTTITKRFGKPGSAPAQYGKDGAFQRASSGFMSMQWDGGDIAFQPETWEAFYNILYPGAFGMAFGGSRTAHRMAVAIEDAGFIIHPQMSWIYATGFPKATRIDTQIDKHGGVNIGWFGPWLRKYRKENSINQNELSKHFPSKTGGLTGCVSNWELGMNMPTAEQFNTLCNALDLPFKSIEEAEREIVGHGSDSGNRTVTILPDEPKEWDITIPSTDLAKQWEGHRYGLQALKPASEPIIVFQKPYEGRPIDCITETGAGALNIDGSRIGGRDRTEYGLENSKRTQGVTYGTPNSDANFDSNKGRWPANFVLTHSPQCEMVGYRDSDSYQINRFTDGAKPFGDAVGEAFETEEIEGGRVPVWECVEGCPVLALDKQSGHLTSGQIKPEHNKSGKYGGSSFNSSITKSTTTCNSSSGGASRFFHQSHWAIENADPFVYQAKVSVSERNAGLSNYDAIGGKAGEVTVRGNTNPICQKCGGSLIDRGKGICSCKEPEYKAINKTTRNPHPTLKPIALIEHLATLLLPPDEYSPRRICVPFAGVASEIIGCWRAGWDEIVGIEMEAEYAEIGRARIEYWLKQGVQLDLW